jgi:lantibiotic leader peptide-processing serine protease
MKIRVMVGIAALALALVACGPMQEPQADVQHWWDYDDGAAVLAAFPETELSTLATGTQRFIVSRNGVLRGLDAHAARAGDRLVVFLPDAGFAVVETNDPRSYRRFGDVVVRDVVVQWQEPTTTVVFEADVGDPPFSGSADFFFDLQWGHVPVGATAAWAAGVRGEGVRVAVIDGGFDLTHPDLVPNINFELSLNFVDGESLQYGLPDPLSHGAHVAGTIAAAENDFGIIGVAPDAELVLLKALGDGGSGSFGDVGEAMVYAADVGAHIANMSLGANIPQSGIPGDITAREVAELRVFMQRIANYGTHAGTLYVTSAGNSGLDRDTTADLLVLPADINRVVTVSATAPIGWATDPLNTFLENLASYSNYGRSAIDVSAPGGDFVYPTDEPCLVAGLVRPCWVFDLVFSTGNQGWYWSAGTSMAAPHASGVAALILSENEALKGKPAQLAQELYRRTEDLGQRGQDPEHGRGAVRSGY